MTTVEHDGQSGLIHEVINNYIGYAQILFKRNTKLIHALPMASFVGVV